MRTARPHVAIKMEAADEMAKISGCAQKVHVQDHVNFLFSRFEAMWHELITYPVRFLDGPFTFEWIT